MPVSVDVDVRGAASSRLRSACVSGVRPSVGVNQEGIGGTGGAPSCIQKGRLFVLVALCCEDEAGDISLLPKLYMEGDNCELSRTLVMMSCHRESVIVARARGLLAYKHRFGSDMQAS